MSERREIPRIETYVGRDESESRAGKHRNRIKAEGYDPAYGMSDFRRKEVVVRVPEIPEVVDRDLGVRVERVLRPGDKWAVLFAEWDGRGKGNE